MIGGTNRTRVLIAKEYARTLAGLGVVYGMIALYNSFQEDQKDKFTVETDPRSSDFMKPKLGDTRIDLLAGTSQSSVLLTRIITGTTKNATGEISKMRSGFTLKGKEQQYGGMTTASAFGQFLRNKLAPVVGTAYDIAIGGGKDAVGETVTPASVLASNTIPLSFRDIYSAMQQEKIPSKVAMSLLVVMGIGLQKYSGATADKFAVEIAQHAKIVDKNKNTREVTDHTNEITQVITQAKKLGLTERDLIIALKHKMKSEHHTQAIDTWVQRLHRRWNTM
jgi:hypothetical protein